MTDPQFGQLVDVFEGRYIPVAIEEGFTEVAPPVSTLNELEALLSYPGLYIHSPKDGVCLLGLEFECE